MPQPWPPPPDLASIKELVQTADIEGFLAEGAPPDEYDTEAEQLHAAIAHLPAAEITAPNVTPAIEAIWRSSFSLNDAALNERSVAILILAQQIARFFGPEAQPLVRT